MTVTKMEDPKDVLRQVQADILGVSPDKIKFSDYRQKKRKKKVEKIVESESNSTTVENEEGFTVENVTVESCSFADIGRRRLKKKNNLEEWGAFDFFLYAEKKHMDKYGNKWGLNIGGGSLEINRIRNKFYDLFGFCCNLIMRDYIDFFFEHYMDLMVNSDDGFYFSQMRNDKIICEFHDGYDFSQSFLQYSESEKQCDEDTISNKVIKESYLIGDTSLVSNYGIVIALNWLIKVKKISPTEASRMVLAACREFAVKGMIDVVKSATEMYSPYPSSLLFKDPQMVIDKIDENIKIDVEFNDNSKYEFLQ